MNRDDIVKDWVEAASSGTLLTPKHDPNSLNITWDKYRSVLTLQMSSSLENFISSGEYAINHYDDSSYPRGAGYFEVVPCATSGFAVVGSGVPSGSMTPTGSLDRLIFVSGSKQGWHVYAETSSAISGSLASGRLSLKGSL